MAERTALKLRDYGVPDLDSLLDLARRKSKEGRQALFATDEDLFLHSGSELTDRERALMGNILKRLIADVEKRVRKEIAERMAKRSDAPRELITALASDDIEVAHSILVNSSVLRDVDLIEIIRHRTQAHQLAISVRKDVSEDVSQALVETGDADVITSLLKNGEASISRSLMEYLVAESKRIDTFQMPLVQRDDLPADLARKMYWWVSAALRDHIIEHFDVDPGTLDDSIEGAVNDAIKEGIQVEQPTEAERFADQMAARGQLSEEFLLETLRQGEVSLFEGCFAKATEIDLKLARRLLYEPGGEALALACKAAGFRRGTFATIFQLTRKATSSNTTTDIARITDFFDRVSTGHAKSVRREWLRNPEYLNAQRQLHGEG